MSATNAEFSSPGTVEAVIISGPRKGEFITLPTTEVELTPEEDAALQTLLEGTRELAESARAASREAEALLAALRTLTEGQ